MQLAPWARSPTLTRSSRYGTRSPKPPKFSASAGRWHTRWPAATKSVAVVRAFPRSGLATACAYLVGRSSNSRAAVGSLPCANSPTTCAPDTRLRLVGWRCVGCGTTAERPPLVSGPSVACRVRIVRVTTVPSSSSSYCRRVEDTLVGSRLVRVFSWFDRRWPAGHSSTWVVWAKRSTAASGLETARHSTGPDAGKRWSRAGTHDWRPRGTSVAVAPRSPCRWPCSSMRRALIATHRRAIPSALDPFADRSHHRWRRDPTVP